MERLGFLLLLLVLTISCSTLPDPIPVNPDQAEMDSLLAIYGGAIATKDLTYLRHFEQDEKEIPCSMEVQWISFGSVHSGRTDRWLKRTSSSWI